MRRTRLAMGVGDGGLIAGVILAVIGTNGVSGQTVPTFKDAAEIVGLADYRGSSGDYHGPGVVLTDLNRDGYPDLYVVCGGQDPINELYVNVGDGTGRRFFIRMSGDGGAGHGGAATGAIAGDYDNDGDVDLYLVNFDEPNVLLQNQWMDSHSFVFLDVTAATDPSPGVYDDQFGLATAVYEDVVLDNSLTAAWADVDRDGDLDLYVGNHNGWWQHPIEGPFDLPGRRDVFYLNNGDGTFTDATMAYDVPGYVSQNGDHQTGNQRFSSTNAVIFADFDNDGWPDLLVTNKIGSPEDRDMLYVNRGADADGGWLGFRLMTYELIPEFGNWSGAAMGVDVADYDNDGDLDVYITDWSNLPAGQPGKNDLWINRIAQTGRLSFQHSDAMLALFSWGTQWQDFDNDGRQDLYVGVEAPARDFLFMNSVENGMVEVGEAAGVAQTGSARGVVTADYDRDGWVDVFVVNVAGDPSRLFRNETGLHEPDRGFLSIRLAGDPHADAPFRSSRDAIGARVTIVCDLDGDGVITFAERQMRELCAGGSNAASTSAMAIEYGTGLAPGGTGEIAWPSGRRTTFRFASRRFLDVDEVQLVVGDFDLNTRVDVLDLIALLAGWGPCPPGPEFCPADIYRDGSVTVLDLILLLANWSPAPG